MDWVDSSWHGTVSLAENRKILYKILNTRHFPAWSLVVRKTRLGKISRRQLRFSENHGRSHSTHRTQQTNETPSKFSESKIGRSNWSQDWSIWTRNRSDMKTNQNKSSLGLTWRAKGVKCYAEEEEDGGFRDRGHVRRARNCDRLNPPYLYCDVIDKEWKVEHWSAMAKMGYMDCSLCVKINVRTIRVAWGQEVAGLERETRRETRRKQLKSLARRRTVH